MAPLCRAPLIRLRRSQREGDGTERTCFDVARREKRPALCEETKAEVGRLSRFLGPREAGRPAFPSGVPEGAESFPVCIKICLPGTIGNPPQSKQSFTLGKEH